MSTRVVIVGGGFGGLATAQALAGEDVDVTLIDRRNHHLFQPLLYQVATASLSPTDIAEPLRAILSRQSNLRVRLGEVTEVRPDAHEIVIDEPEHGAVTLPYDRLVLAVGAKASWFGNDQWAKHALPLKSIGDALLMRQRILMAFERAEWETDPERRRALLTFVVVGGGATGVEVAGAIAEIAFQTFRGDFKTIGADEPRVILVEGADGLLTVYPKSLQQKAQQQIESLGVEVRLSTVVKDIGEGWIQLGDDRLATHTVLWGAGVQAEELPATLGEGVQRDRGGRVTVEASCTVPGHPHVYVIGDAARFEHTEDGAPLPGLAPVAQQMGRYVAKHLLGRVDGPFRYADKGSMATIGRRRAVMKSGKLELSGFVAWLLWGIVHLGTLVTFRNRAVVFLKWFWSWLTYDRASRLIWTPRWENR